MWDYIYLVFNPIRDMRRNKYYLIRQKVQACSFQNYRNDRHSWLPDVGASIFSLLAQYIGQTYLWSWNYEGLAYAELAELGNWICLCLCFVHFFDSILFVIEVQGFSLPSDYLTFFKWSFLMLIIKNWGYYQEQNCFIVKTIF